MTPPLNCANCGSGKKLATGIWYTCEDIRSLIKIAASIHSCRYWRARGEKK